MFGKAAAVLKLLLDVSAVSVLTSRVFLAAQLCALLPSCQVALRAVTFVGLGRMFMFLEAPSRAMHSHFIFFLASNTPAFPRLGNDKCFHAVYFLRRWGK